MAGVLGCVPLASADATATQQIPKVEVGQAAVPPAEVESALDECARNMSALPPRTCLDRFFVPRWLLDRAARTQKIEARASFVPIRNDILYRALVRRIESQVDEPSAEQVEDYMASQPRDFEKPLRIRIFRILLNTKSEAEGVLAELRSPLDLTQFRALARKYSVDAATNERGGDLGFVWPDGSTDVPQVSAEPALYQAALPLEEGEWAKEPIAEEKRFAVVWRRGSLPPEANDQADRRRAALLWKERARGQRVDALLAELRDKYVHGRADVLLGRLRRKNTGLFAEP